MSLRAKFIFFLGALCLAVGINVYAAMKSTSLLLAKAATVYKPTFEAEAIVKFARIDLEHQHELLQESFEQPEITSAQLRRFEELAAVLRSDLTRVFKIIRHVPDLHAPNQILQRLEQHQAEVLNYLRAAEKPELRQARERFRESYGEAHALLAKDLKDFDRRLFEAQNAAANDTSQDVQGLVTGILLGMALAEFVIVLVVLALFRDWMLRPIQEIRRATEEIAAGNLDYRLGHTGKDELGALAVQVNSMAESLSRAQRQLKQRERMAAVGEMTSVVAHNIRNPLAGIRATAQTALHSISEDSEFRGKQEQIIKAVDSLEQWLKELLHLNRPLQLKLEQTDVDELVDDLKQIFRPTCERKDVELDYVAQEPHLAINIDRQYFVQAVASILDNAIEASPRNAKVTISTGRNGASKDAFFIEIRDSGAGIPESIRKQVFEPYFSTKPGGTGIGLAMAKKIIEAHSGVLTISDRSAHPDQTGAICHIEVPNRPSTPSGANRHGKSHHSG